MLMKKSLKSTQMIVFLFLLIVFLLFVIVATLVSTASAYSPSGEQPAEWAVSVPTKGCNGGGSNCQLSSPAIVDINGDGQKNIIVATNSGQIVALRENGAVLWSKDVSGAFGMAAGTHEISSSPAIGDIDNDGDLEIVVGAGTTNPSVCTQGGMIVLDHNGNVVGGWPQHSSDNAVPPAGCADTIFSTPALGDLDNDGDLEIVAGGFDKRIYIWNHDGSRFSYVDSFYLDRFPDWGQFDGRLGDTIWSSPALADIDGDGYLDIVIGTDEGGFDSRWGGDSDGWTCPYASPPGGTPGYCGGSIYVIDRFGNGLPGFPKFVLEAVQSTPVITDLNGDGDPDIVVGTGSFYYDNSPDHPTVGLRVFAWDSDGDPLHGWENGKATNGPPSASLSIGDITGDGQPNVVIGTRDGYINAWHATGQSVGGFPLHPKDNFGNYAIHDVGKGIILADYNGDGDMEVIFTHNWSIAIFDGDGKQLTAAGQYSGKPTYYAGGSLMNNVAVADMDGDGQLEMVVQNSKVMLWDLPTSSDSAEWPMFKRNPARLSATLSGAAPQAAPIDDVQMLNPADGSNPRTNVVFGVSSADSGTLSWQADTPSRVSLSPASGSTSAKSVTMEMDINVQGMSTGWHDLGTVSVDGTFESSSGGGQQNIGTSFDVRVYVGPISATFMPILTSK